MKKSTVLEQQSVALEINFHAFQGESVFRLRNFNILGFLLFILLRYMFRSLDHLQATHIFHRIYSIDNGRVNRDDPKTEAQ
jgi:hypothetical protein